MIEEWRPVAGFEDRYEVSSLGRVRSIPHVRRDGRRWPGKVKSQRRGTHGYSIVDLSKDGKGYARDVHRLVAEAFLGAPKPGLEVRHLNGDARDNRIGNLAWGTHSENIRDAVRHGTHSEIRKTHCPRGHEYTRENTRLDRHGHRDCKACDRGRVRRGD